MRKIWWLCLLLLAACNNDTEKPTNFKAQSDIIGHVAFGNLKSAIVSVYEINQCQKGRKLDELFLTGGNDFQFNFELDKPEIILLIEVSNLTYNEFSSEKIVANSKSSLFASLVAEGNTSKNVTLGYWSTLAHAKAQYECQSNSVDIKQAIHDSNALFSQLLLFDVIATLPQALDVEPIIVADDYTAIRAALANAAVSYLTYGMDVQNGSAAGHDNLNSADFVKLSFDDLVYDGLLDGMGEVGQLNFGELALNADTYRTNLPNAIYYALAVKNPSPDSAHDQVKASALTFNAAVDVNLFPDTDRIPVDESPEPQLLDADYFRCPRSDSCTPKVGCNACWTIIANPDRYLNCKVTMYLDIRNNIGLAPDPSAENIYVNSSSAELSQSSPLPGAYPQTHYYIEYPYSGDTSSPGTVTGVRDIEMVVVDPFGLSNTVKLHVDSRVPTAVGQGVWYNQNFECSVSQIP